VPGVQPLRSIDVGRTTAWREVPAPEIEGAWSLEDSAILLKRCASDGRLFLRIEAHGHEGYRFWAPYYGRHLVSFDGRAISSAPPRVPPARWQRHFFGEVLPLAAGLQGLSVFRASAVSLGDRVVVIGGPPASGKTAVIAHLIALGATFVSDDVVALEQLGEDVVAYPGPTRLGVKDAELHRIPSTQEARLGRGIGRSDTLIFEPSPITRPLPVRSVYLLQPETRLDRIAVSPSDIAAGRALSDADMLSYLAADETRSRTLELFCKAVDRTADAYTVMTPRRARARDVAARILAHTS
jgi:hypothetical protein